MFGSQLTWYTLYIFRNTTELPLEMLPFSASLGLTASGRVLSSLCIITQGMARSCCSSWHYYTVDKAGGCLSFVLLTSSHLREDWFYYLSLRGFMHVSMQRLMSDVFLLLLSTWLIFLILHVCMHNYACMYGMYVCGHVHAVVHVWRSKDNLQE